MNFYNQRFQIGRTQQQVEDPINFPQTLQGLCFLADSGLGACQSGLGGLVKFSRKTSQNVKYSAWAALAGLLASVMLVPSPGYAQAEIDPDHYDSPNSEPIRELVRVIRYDGTFFLPYSALCNGKKLPPGKYSISFRFDGVVGRATLNQEKHAIEIAPVVQREAPKQGDEVVVLGDNQRGRTLSAVRVTGFEFVFDPKHSAAPPGGKPELTRKLPLKVIVRNEITTQVASHAPLKP